MKLGPLEKEIIILLQQDPMLSYVRLGEKLGLAPATVRKKIDSMRDTRPPVLGNVIARLNLDRVGLERHTFFLDLDKVNFDESMQVLTHIANHHPYTTYLNRVFGRVNGVFIQFDIPKGSRPELLGGFSFLYDMGVFSDFYHLPPPVRRYNSYPMIEFWKGDHWEFNFEGWIQGECGDKEPEKKSEVKGRGKLRRMDVILLRELMINARRKQRQICEDICSSPESIYSKEEKTDFSVDKQRLISRRFEKIREQQLIDSYTLLFNKQRFQLYNQMLFTGKFTLSDGRSIEHRMMNDKLPFRSALQIFETGDFLWWINLPPSISSQFMNFLMSRTRELQVSILDNIYSHSYSYPLWHKNFVGEDGVFWRTGDEWMGTSFFRDQLEICCGEK